ncbi:MAG: CvpA family protein [Bacteroidaceae bacterium]|nr:CvpA family protein [Bacteroidaceae bacterium]
MIELLCLAILLYGAFRGWKNGLVKEVISFVGFFLGFFIAYEYYKRAEVGVLGFLLIWIGIPLVLGMIAWLVTKVIDKIIVVSTLNRLLGAAAGFLKYAFLIGCVILAIDYVREAKNKLEENPVVKVLEAVPGLLFPDVSKEVEDGGEK